MKYKYEDFLYDYDYGTGKLYKGNPTCILKAMAGSEYVIF